MSEAIRQAPAGVIHPPHPHASEHATAPPKVGGVRLPWQAKSRASLFTRQKRRPRRPLRPAAPLAPLTRGQLLLQGSLTMFAVVLFGFLINLTMLSQLQHVVS